MSYENIRKNTKEVYEYIIRDILDKDREVTGYKEIKGDPSKTGKGNIASEIYTYFLTHYFKAIDIYKVKKDICIDWIEDSKVLNIVDIGANIGTVTFAYLDSLIDNKKINGLKFKIIFVEVDYDRCKLLDLSIKKYIENSGLNIKYKIINEKYEDCVDKVINELEEADTIILMSNILNWINDSIWNKFKESISKNIESIEKKYGCRVINIEATSENNSHLKIGKLYNDIKTVGISKINRSKMMPKFKNISECWFKNKYYNPKSRKYFYGYLIKYANFDLKLNQEIIDVAYNKTILTYKNYNLFDNIEKKYINLNFCNIKKYIYELICSRRKVRGYDYQYKIQKNKEKTRPMYLDDIINDIIYTIIILVEGISVDLKQDDNISYGNRVDCDFNSPYVFRSYYKQYFKKLKNKELIYINDYNYYNKIDISKYYNSISKDKLFKIIEDDKNLNKEWCNKYIKEYIEKEFEDCKNGYGIAQGPDLSNLLANMYLNEFDSWFMDKYRNAKIIRYVDDIEIFAKTKEECEEITDKSKKYLKETLMLSTNDKKDRSGEVTDILSSKKEEFFEEINEISTYILRSFYKLDKQNYKKFIDNPKNFILIYKECLKKLNINLSEEWLNIKICNEIKYLKKMKKKIKNGYLRQKWFENKKIYMSELKLGEIPNKKSDRLIDIWFDEFSKNNFIFMEMIKELNTKIETKLSEVFIEIESDNSIIDDKKSILKFLTNKLAVFKSKKLINYLDKMEKFCPYYDKKILEGYDECYEYVVDNFISKNDYKSYDYVMGIWLIGKYKKEKSISILEDIFYNTIEQPENKEANFINSIVTEALLNVGYSDNLINKIKIKVEELEVYYLVRNCLLLLNVADSIKEVCEKLKKKGFVDDRILIFVEWIEKNPGINLSKEYESIPEEFRKQYPDYPIETIYY